MIRKLTIITVCALASLASLRAAELTPLRVGYNNWVGFVAFFVAQEKGFFKEAGLEVQPKTFAAPGDGLVPLLSGDLDIHLSTVDATILRSAAAPDSLKVVALVDTSAGADAVLGSPAVKTPADLKGKRVAVTLGECNEVLLVKALKSAGLTEADVTMVNMDPDAAGTALKAGSVDAAVTWEPWISQLVGAGNANTVFTTKEAPNVLTDCVVITKATAKDRTTAVQGFLQAMDRATKFTRENPDEAAAIAGQALEVDPSEITAMLGKVEIYDLAASKAAMEGPALQAAADLLAFFQQKGSVAPSTSIEGIFLPDFAAQP